MASEPLPNWPEALDARRCPRCSADLRAGATTCDRCGLDLDPASGGVRVQAVGPVCPRCDRVVEPGTTFVASTGPSELGTCPHCGTGLVAPDAAPGAAYEEKAVRCAPHEIERIARAEAADGWALEDTTVDERDPGMILAHFRRGVRLKAVPAPQPSAKAAPEPPPAAARPRRDDARKAKRPEPAPIAEPAAGAPLPEGRFGDVADPDVQRILFWLGVFAVFLFVVDAIGLMNLFVILFVLNGLRKFLKAPDSDRRARRARRRRSRDD